MNLLGNELKYSLNYVEKVTCWGHHTSKTDWFRHCMRSHGDRDSALPTERSRAIPTFSIHSEKLNCESLNMPEFKAGAVVAGETSIFFHPNFSALDFRHENCSLSAKVCGGIPTELFCLFMLRIFVGRPDTAAKESESSKLY